MEQDTEKQNNLSQALDIEALFNRGVDSGKGLETLIDSPESLQKPAQQETAIGLPPIPQITQQKVSADDSVFIADNTDDNSNPAIAEDEDLIEKEWVDRAKQIVSENRQDPYKQEESVSNLKADYLKKRFGRELGISK